MATTKILLREDVENLGGRGEIVRVKAGYARNYLLPQKLASLATKGNINSIEKERTALLKKAATEKTTAEAQSEQMKNISLSFERKSSGEGGTLFGSVTSMDIAEALKAKGYDIDRRKIVLKDAIKETGDFTVNVKLHREVTLQIPVTVSSEGGEKASSKTAKAKAVTAEPTATETTPDTEEVATSDEIES